MRKTLLVLLGLTVIANSYAQRQCGIVQVKNALIAKDANWVLKIENQRASLQGIANQYQQQQSARAAAKTTATSPIPVIFHIVVNASQLAQMGGYVGIQTRCDSQIAVLNRDFNRQNSDSTIIPSGWKSLYGNAGIHFGLAHTAPNGWGTPGYELILLPSTSSGFTEGSSGFYSDAKHAATGGADAWDVTKYINVWCFNFDDGTGNLGLTMAKSMTSTASEEGVSLTWLALGKQITDGSLKFPPGGTFTQGRTLTHEMGHFFEIWHTWGDDNGKCTWNGGVDDGIADTPPEADHKYGIPVDTIAGGTIYDACEYSGLAQMQPIGVGSLDFMNYTDDVAMALFTPQQAAVMASMVAPGGESYSLTQNPGLLNWPANAGVTLTAQNSSFTISPNPSNGVFNITFNDITDELKSVSVVNVIGEPVKTTAITVTVKDYSIDLSAMSKGIYFVRCNFASGSVTRKILLQ